MRMDLNRPLTPAQKKKGEILLEECPKDFLVKYNFPTEFRVEKDIREACEIFGVHLFDLAPEAANRVFKRFAWVDEVYSE